MVDADIDADDDDDAAAAACTIEDDDDEKMGAEGGATAAVCGGAAAAAFCLRGDVKISSRSLNASRVCNVTSAAAAATAAADGAFRPILKMDAPPPTNPCVEGGAEGGWAIALDASATLGAEPSAEARSAPPNEVEEAGANAADDPPTPPLVTLVRKNFKRSRGGGGSHRRSGKASPRDDAARVRGLQLRLAGERGRDATR